MLSTKQPNLKLLSTTFLILTSLFGIGIISSAPLKPLNERSKELTWQAWLLVDDQNNNNNKQYTGEDGLMRRRITPKSVFIAPTFSPSDLPACADGYASDSMGRCVKLIQLDENAHLNYLLERLRQQFGNFSEDYPDEEEEIEEDFEQDKATPGPFQFNIPLQEEGVEQQASNEANVAIVVAPTNGSFNLSMSSDGGNNVKADEEKFEDEEFGVPIIITRINVGEDQGLKKSGNTRDDANKLGGNTKVDGVATNGDGAVAMESTSSVKVDAENSTDTSESNTSKVNKRTSSDVSGAGTSTVAMEIDGNPSGLKDETKSKLPVDASDISAVAIETNMKTNTKDGTNAATSTVGVSETDAVNAVAVETPVDEQQAIFFKIPENNGMNLEKVEASSAKDTTTPNFVRFPEMPQQDQPVVSSQQLLPFVERRDKFRNDLLSQTGEMLAQDDVKKMVLNDVGEKLPQDTVKKTTENQEINTMLPHGNVKKSTQDLYGALPPHVNVKKSPQDVFEQLLPHANVKMTENIFDGESSSASTHQNHQNGDQLTEKPVRVYNHRNRDKWLFPPAWRDSPPQKPLVLRFNHHHHQSQNAQFFDQSRHGQREPAGVYRRVPPQDLSYIFGIRDAHR